MSSASNPISRLRNSKLPPSKRQSRNQRPSAIRRRRRARTALKRSPAELQKSQTSSSQPAAPAPKSAEPLAGLRESQRSDTAPSAAQARPEARAMRSGAGPSRSQSVWRLLLRSEWLQGIVDLKRQGRDEEAEKQLGDFRKRYPDYRIPEAIAEKFEKR